MALTNIKAKMQLAEDNAKKIHDLYTRTECDDLRGFAKT